MWVAKYHSIFSKACDGKELFYLRIQSVLWIEKLQKLNLTNHNLTWIVQVKLDIFLNNVGVVLSMWKEGLFLINNCIIADIQHYRHCIVDIEWIIICHCWYMYTDIGECWNIVIKAIVFSKINTFVDPTL